MTEYTIKKFLDQYSEFKIYFEDDWWLKNLSGCWNFEQKCENEFLNFPTSAIFSKSSDIGNFTTINGPVIIGRKVTILNGAFIEGPVFIGENTIVGPNCFVRPNTIIANNVRIGQGVEIKASLINSNVSIAHFSYVGHSVIGKSAMLAAGVIIATRMLADTAIQLKIGNRIVNTGKRKIGAYIGSNVKIASGVNIMPGKIIPSGKLVFTKNMY